MSLAIVVDTKFTAVGELPPHLTFTEAPPGMATFSDFDITALDSLGLMFALRATTDPGLRLFAISPRPYFPDYNPQIPDAARTSLDLADDEDPLLLAVVSPVAGGETTANLLAPIAVNARTGAALQVVLETDEWPLRAPLGHERSAA